MADTDKLNIDSVIARLLEAKGSFKQFDNVIEVEMISQKEILQLCQLAINIFMGEPSLLEVTAPINVCGDIHGQYTDLLRHFQNGGFPPDYRYLFLGDYVDRGRQSLEVICLLLAYKIRYRDKIFILRGNHECCNINRIYGFYDECKRRASIKIWKAFTDVFNCLPVAAIIEEKIFCCHGGLSPDLNSFDDIRGISRPSGVPEHGLLCDLLWSDPNENVINWGPNSRGISYTFGESAVKKFCQKHCIDLIVRAHEVVEDGYQFFAGRKLVTIFSAPNYCGECDNAGTLMSVDENLLCKFKILAPQPKKSIKTGTRLEAPIESNFNQDLIRDCYHPVMM